MKIRILLADDHPMIRAGFKSMLDKNERFEIVGEAGNGKELVEQAGQLKPDIILVDISMPVMNGLDALKMRCPLFSRKQTLYRTSSQGGLFVFNSHSVRMNQGHRSAGEAT